MDVGHILQESIQAGCKMYSDVQKLINSIWNKEEFPQQCKTIYYYTIPNTADKTNCSNY
jgi:hypothetical protein